MPEKMRMAGLSLWRTNGSPELLIVMAGGATAEQTENVVARLHEVGATRASRAGARRP